MSFTRDCNTGAIVPSSNARPDCASLYRFPISSFNPKRSNWCKERQLASLLKGQSDTAEGVGQGCGCLILGVVIGAAPNPIRPAILNPLRAHIRNALHLRPARKTHVPQRLHLPENALCGLR